MDTTATMLHLKLPTDPRWVNIAEKNIDEILVDHAYCEQKAASSCISLIIQYPDRQEIVETLTPIVAEEWEHFERVIKQLKKRGYQLGKMRKDEYVAELLKFIQKGGKEENRLVDKLLMCALIEARSCERFKLLSKHIQDDELKEFYYELMISEAGHYTTFITLARDVLSREEVDKRWQEFLDYEAKVLENLEPRSDRMH